MTVPTREASFVDLAQSRRSIRHFRDTPVPREMVTEVLRVAMHAPSPHNVQPWRFTGLFSLPEKVGLAQAMAARLEEDLRRDGVASSQITLQVARSTWRVTSAPVVLVCSLVSEGLVQYADERRNTLEWQMAVQSLGAVLQTLFLAACERGIGSCWMAAPMYCPDAVREVLSLPAEYEPQALALLGYEASPGRVRGRREFDEIVDLR